MLEVGQRHFQPVDLDKASAGHVVVFRMHRQAIAKHVAVLCGGGQMIHALEGAGVVEVPYRGWWQRRAVAAFAFP